MRRRAVRKKSLEKNARRDEDEREEEREEGEEGEERDD